MNYSYESRSAEKLTAAADQLDRDGIVYDESDHVLGRDTIKHRPPELLEVLRKHGYQGGKLEPFGYSYKDYGQIDCLYDSERFELRQVRRLMDAFHAAQVRAAQSIAVSSEH